MGDLIPTLGGADSLHQLQADWDILRERIQKGISCVTKYYKESREEPVQSPASTAPKLYHSFDPLRDIETRIREYRTLVPTHSSSTRPQEEHAQLVRRPLEHWVALDPKLADAFPIREEEEDPIAFSYNPRSGACEDVPHTSASSIGDPGFVPPLEEERKISRPA